MKTTLDLPEELVRVAKLRALTQGRTLRDLVTQLLRQGLALDAPNPVSDMQQGSMVVMGSNGLPVIRCRPDAPAVKMKTQELLQLEQQSQIEQDVQRARVSV